MSLEPQIPPGLEAFPIRVPLEVAWGDMDAFGHVNNAVYFKYFETARIAYFQHFDWAMPRRGEAPHAIGPILAETSCRFRRPLVYPDYLVTAASIPALDPDPAADRFLMHYALYSHTHDAIAATGTGLVVCFDYTDNQKVPLPAAVRRAIAGLQHLPEEGSREEGSRG